METGEYVDKKRAPCRHGPRFGALHVYQTDRSAVAREPLGANRVAVQQSLDRATVSS